MSACKLNYNFMLFGKVGCGKSSLANTLLNQKRFATSCSFKPCTEDTVKKSMEFSKYILNVVDTPGITDVQKNAEEIVNIMFKGMTHMPEGFNALLFVLKLGDRATDELIEAVNILKALFGDSKFKEVCIICFTFADFFEEMKNDNIQRWCQSDENIDKGSAIGTLLEDCGYRVVLFDNRHEEKRGESVEKLLAYINPQAPRYTIEHFQKCTDARDAYVASLGFPEQISKIQMQINRLLAAHTRDPNIEEILIQLVELLKTIEIESRGTNMMDDLKLKVNELKDQIESPTNENKDKSAVKYKIRSALKRTKDVKIVSGVIGTTVLGALSAGIAFTVVGSLTLIPGIGLCTVLGIITIASGTFLIYAFKKKQDLSKEKKVNDEGDEELLNE